MPREEGLRCACAVGCVCAAYLLCPQKARLGGRASISAQQEQQLGAASSRREQDKAEDGRSGKDCSNESFPSLCSRLVPRDEARVCHERVVELLLVHLLVFRRRLLHALPKLRGDRCRTTEEAAAHCSGVASSRGRGLSCCDVELFVSGCDDAHGRREGEASPPRGQPRPRAFGAAQTGQQGRRQGVVCR